MRSSRSLLFVLLGISAGLQACTSAGVVIGDDKAEDGGGSDGGGEVGGGGDDGGDDGSSDPANEDNDGDGYTPNDGDCDDEDGDVNPDGDEGDEADGVDDDCNGVADDKSVCDDGNADFEEIQEGIDDAPEDFVLLICAGTYEEDLVIDRAITIQSVEGPEDTIVEGSGSGPVLTINRVDREDADWGAGVVGLTFTGGLAEQGGGIYVNRSDVHISGNIVESNEATTRGGGVYLTESEGDFVDNLVSNNVSVEGGGFVSWQSDERIENNTFQSNTATTTSEETYGSGSGGGGVLLYGGNDFVGNTVDGNVTGYNGGGMYVLYGAPTLDGNTFSGNYSGEDGGGIYMNQSQLDFINNDVLYNEAYDDAGGIRGYVCRGEFHDNQIIGNVASDDAGGMKVSHSSNSIADNWFEANVTGDAGGGLELDNDTSDVTGTTFIDNVAGRGAGLHSWTNEGRLTLEDLYFQGNEATDCGGAIQMDNNPYLVTVRNIEAFENSAVDGAALCLDKKPIDSDYDVEEPGNTEESKVKVSASVFADNTASDDGAGVYNKLGHLTLSNVTIADSTGVEGAIALKELSETTLVNVSITGISGTGGILWEEGTLDISYSNFDDLDGDVIIGGSSPVGSDGNISEDPDYADPGGWDYSLSSGSDLIDAGDPSIKDSDGTRSDIGASGGPDA